MQETNELAQVEALLGFLQSRRRDIASAEEEHQSAPYYGWTPQYVGTLKPGVIPPTNYSSRCFGWFTLESSWKNDQEVLIGITTGPLRTAVPKCKHNQLQFFLPEMPLKDMGPTENCFQSFTWNVSKLSPSARWYFDTLGIRVFQMNSETETLVIDLLATVVLMSGLVEVPLQNFTIEANVGFMSRYVQSAPRMQPVPERRPNAQPILLSHSDVKSGDLLIAIRYDGLDPSLAWLQGFTAAHTAVALRDPDTDALFVCETNVKSSFWPKDGVQCSHWEEWMGYVDRAELQVLLAPGQNATFNTSAAWEFVQAHYGTSYGYSTLLFSWWDVPKDNYPCNAPDFTDCESVQFEELKVYMLDKSMGNSSNNLYRQAFNNRLQAAAATNNAPTPPSNLTALEIMAYVDTHFNMSFSDLVTMPEQDNWRYRIDVNGTTVENGRSMVCSVFTCLVWKAGGWFGDLGDSIQCAEQTPYDLAAMQLFDMERTGFLRPASCVSQDPDNLLCQIAGTYSLHAHPDFNTRPLRAKMGNHCPSKAPNYTRPEFC